MQKAYGMRIRLVYQKFFYGITLLHISAGHELYLVNFYEVRIAPAYLRIRLHFFFPIVISNVREGNSFICRSKKTCAGYGYARKRFYFIQKLSAMFRHSIAGTIEINYRIFVKAYIRVKRVINL